MDRYNGSSGDGCLGQIILWGLFGGAAGCVICFLEGNILGAIIGAAAFVGAIAFLMHLERQGMSDQTTIIKNDNSIEHATNRNIHYIPCPKCGRATDASLRACSHCGYELTINSAIGQKAGQSREKPKSKPSSNATPEELAKDVYYTFISSAFPISRNMSDRVFDQSLIISDTFRKDGKEAAIKKLKAVCKSWANLGSDGGYGVVALLDTLKNKVLTEQEANSLITELSEWVQGIESADNIKDQYDISYEKAVAKYGPSIFVSSYQGSLIQSSLAILMDNSNPTPKDLDRFYDMYAFFGQSRAKNVSVSDTVSAFLDKYYEVFNGDLNRAYHVIAFCLLKSSDKDGDKIYYSNNPDSASVYLKYQVDAFANSFNKRREEDLDRLEKSRNNSNAQSEESWECPNCGNIVSNQDVYCSKCGVRLQNHKADTPKADVVKILTYDDKLIIRDNKGNDDRTIPVKAEITVIRSSGNEKREIVSIYQKTPDTYYIDRSTYDHLKSYGVICVQVYDSAKEKDRHYAEDGFGSLDDQSLLAKCGYTTKASEQLTDVQRQKVLLYLLKNDFWTKKRLISHLEWCIRNHPQDMYELNRAKWEKDIKYVKQVIV